MDRDELSEILSRYPDSTEVVLLTDPEYGEVEATGLNVGDLTVMLTRSEMYKPAAVVPNSTSDELKPCPFCRSGDIGFRPYSDLAPNLNVAFCRHCLAVGPPPYPANPSVEAATETWNRRAPPQSQTNAMTREEIAP